MQTVRAELVKGKKVLVRYDLDVPLRHPSIQLRTGAQGRPGLEVADDFRLKAGLPTLQLCLENASQVILLGHVGRPAGPDKDSRFSVKPIYEWLVEKGYEGDLKSGKLRLLENLRFEVGEDECSLDYAKELASFGNFFVNEAFAAYHKAASTTILPTLLPHAAGLRFASEVGALTEVRNHPKKPLVVVVGGVKIEDKLALIQSMAEQASAILVGGKMAYQVHEESFSFPHNVLAAKLTSDGFDISAQSLAAWKPIIEAAKMIVWNGPMGKVEELVFQRGSHDLARMILESEAEVVVGGGDTVGFLEKNLLLPLFQEKGLVSTGGGAMLELLVKGSLPTVDALDDSN